MRTFRRRFVLAVAILMLFAACGDDEGSSSLKDEKTATTEADEKSELNKDDQDLADRVVLTLDDFPSGWTAGEEDPDEETDSEDEEDDEDDPLEQCLGSDQADELEDATTGEGESPEFSRGETTQAGSFSVVLEGATPAKKGFDILASSKFQGCLEDEMKAQLEDTNDPDAPAEEQVSFGEITTKRASFARVGDQTAAFQIVMPFAAGGQELTFYADFAFFREGRVIGGLFFLNLGEPLDSDTEHQLAEAMAKRAADAA